MNRHALHTLCSLLLVSPVARAGYSPPPDDRDYRDDRHPHHDDDDQRYDDDRRDSRDGRPRSTVRLFTGPAARFDSAVQGGLALALDIGARPAGVRVSGAWMRADSNAGVSQYTGELWIDFDEDSVLHPIVAAGAGLARFDRAGADGKVTASTLGIGLLRGTLHYQLPVRGVDARAGLDLTGAVPAFRSGTESRAPWLTAAVSVGVGF